MRAMKWMKKKIAGLLFFTTLVLGIGIMPIPVGAVTTTDKVLEMKTESTGLNLGDTVEVTFLINETETTGFEGYLDFDDSVLQMQSFTKCSYKPTEQPEGVWSADYQAASRKLSVKWSGAAVTVPTGTAVLTMKFYVKKTVLNTTISFLNAAVFKNQTENNYPSGLKLTVTNSKAKKFTIATENVSGNATVSVPVKVTANGGFNKLTISATFDNQKLLFDSVTVSNGIKDKVTQGGYTYSAEGSKVSVPFTATSDITSTGTLFYMNFKVLNLSSSATAGTNSTSVTVEAEEVANTRNEFFVMNSATSTVFITEGSHVLGDVNGDNKINLVDALYVIRYYNKQQSLATVELTAADVNKNGTVDLVDAYLIMQYYNGVIKSF